jgi:hypothetical protein
LLEGSWFIVINSQNPSGTRLVDRAKAVADGDAFTVRTRIGRRPKAGRYS